MKEKLPERGRVMDAAPANEVVHPHAIGRAALLAIAGHLPRASTSPAAPTLHDATKLMARDLFALAILRNS